MTSPTSAATATSPVPKILLGDDHPLILDALKQMMKPNFEVLTVDNSDSFVNAVNEFQPDVAVLDISMPGADGFTTARRALAHNPNLPIVFLSMHSDPSYHEQAAKLGAKAFVSKRLPAHELLAAIEKVLNNEQMPPVNAHQNGANEDKLTMRQREVLRLIAVGSSAKEIANKLNISVRTAEFHRAAIMQRLGLHSTAQLTRYAMANDIA